LIAPLSVSPGVPDGGGPSGPVGLSPLPPHATIVVSRKGSAHRETDIRRSEAVEALKRMLCR
jgi:hypothetical protein